MSPRSDLKQQSLTFFWKRSPQQEAQEQEEYSDMGSVSDSKIAPATTTRQNTGWLKTVVANQLPRLVRLLHHLHPQRLPPPLHLQHPYLLLVTPVKHQPDTSASAPTSNNEHRGGGAPMMLEIETLKASRKGIEWQGCFPPQSTRSLVTLPVGLQKHFGNFLVERKHFW